MFYIFIANGREDKASMVEDIKGQLESISDAPEYTIYKTTAPQDGCSHVRKVCLERPEDEICFVACGGDGTIGEVASGILSAKAGNPSITGKSMAILALGTGNDFIKYYKGHDFKSVKALFAAEPHQIDAMKVTADSFPGKTFYSVNVTNFGFDAIVGSVGSKLASRGWKNPYRFGIVAAIIAGRFNRISVEVDSEKIGGKRMLLCTLANCHYVGGEFFCAPKAKNDDGLIDVCYLRTMSLFGFLGILTPYTNGEHLDNPEFEKKIIYRRAKNIKVSAPKSIKLCLDGELVDGREFNVDIMPSALTLLVP